MDVSVRRIGCCLLVSGLALFLFSAEGFAADENGGDTAKSEKKSSQGEKESSDGKAGESQAELFMSLISMATLRSYAYGIVKAILILGVFWILGMMLLKMIRRVGRARHVDEGLAEFLGRVVKVAALIVGAITALSEMGIDVGALVAGLGLTGFAFGFAFKDIISNVLAGVLIIMYKPFQVGDQIKIKAYAGRVVSIDLRYTVLNSEGNKVYVPNSLLFTDAIIVESSAGSGQVASAEN